MRLDHLLSRENCLLFNFEGSFELALTALAAIASKLYTNEFLYFEQLMHLSEYEDVDFATCESTLVL